MEWSFSGDAPIYSQIVRCIRLAIASGELAPGERLLSVRELALDAGVNPNTMQRALGDLEREELVFTQRTSGRYVTEDAMLIQSVRKNIAAGILGDFKEAMGNLGYSTAEMAEMLNNAEKEEDTNADT